MFKLREWARSHHISADAMRELREIMGIAPLHNEIVNGAGAESEVQARVRLEAGRLGIKLWRNNVGVLLDDRRIPVRYGLANDSKRLNENMKSADLIGWRPILITNEMVGSVIAQFCSRECKREDWVWCGDARELAQFNWMSAVLADGGDAAFCNKVGTL